MRIIFLVLLLCLMSSCGGGSSSDLFTGVWFGRLVLVQDTPIGCEEDAILDIEHVVSRDGDSINVILKSGGSLDGSTTSNSSFEATFSQAGAFATIFSSITYTNVVDNMADVEFTLSNSNFSPEMGASGCSATWTGQAARQ